MPIVDLHEGDNFALRDGVRIVEMEQLCDMEEMVITLCVNFNQPKNPMTLT